MNGKYRENWLRAALRRASYRYPPRYQAKKASLVSRGIYKCARCRNDYASKEVQLDHIIPVVDPVNGFTTWDDFINRLFCGTEGFQVLCKPCHTLKTNEENGVRRETKSTMPRTRTRSRVAAKAKTSGRKARGKKGSSD